MRELLIVRAFSYQDHASYGLDRQDICQLFDDFIFLQTLDSNGAAQRNSVDEGDRRAKRANWCSSRTFRRMPNSTGSEVEGKTGLLVGGSAGVLDFGLFADDGRAGRAAAAIYCASIPLPLGTGIDYALALERQYPHNRHE